MAFAVALSFLYPVGYRKEIASACASYGVDETLVRSVICVESHYKPDARSRAGAVGLMQLMPQTALWLASVTENSDLATDLYNPADNIMLGTAYLRYLLNKYTLSDALAAYNAGEGNLLRWQAEGRKEYGFQETRDYVKKVYRAMKIYAWRK